MAAVAVAPPSPAKGQGTGRYTVAVVYDTSSDALGGVPGYVASWLKESMYDDTIVGGDPTLKKLQVQKCRSTEGRGGLNRWNFFVSDSTSFHVVEVDLNGKTCLDKQLDCLAVCDEVIVSVFKKVAPARRARGYGCKVTFAVTESHLAGYPPEDASFEAGEEKMIFPDDKALSVGVYKYLVERSTAVGAELAYGGRRIPQVLAEPARKPVEGEPEHPGTLEADLPLRMVKIQRFSKLHVTHARVLQGTLRLGQGLCGANSISTAHPTNHVISMQTYPDGIPLKEAPVGTHVSFKLDSDSELEGYEGQKGKVIAAAKDAAMKRSLASLPVYGLIGSTENVTDLVAAPLMLLVEIPVAPGTNLTPITCYDGYNHIHNSSKPIEAYTAPTKAGVFVDGLGGRSLGYVLGRAQSSTKNYVRLFIIMDRKKNNAAPHFLCRLRMHVEGLHSVKVCVTREVPCGLPNYGKIVGVFNGLEFHRRLFKFIHSQNDGLAKPQPEGTAASRDLTAVESVLQSMLDLTHPMYRMIPALKDQSSGSIYKYDINEPRNQVKVAIMRDVLTNVQCAEHIFFPDVTPEKVLRSPPGRRVSFLNLASGFPRIFKMGLDSINLRFVGHNSGIQMSDVINIVAESCNGKKKMDQVNQWVAGLDSGGGMKPERLLFDAMMELGQSPKVMQLVEGNPKKVDMGMIQPILKSDRFPSYVLFLTALRAPICKQQKLIDLQNKFSPATTEMVRSWIGPTYRKSMQDKVWNSLTLHAAALRRFLFFAFAAANLRFPYNTTSLVFEFLGVEVRR